MKYEIRENVNYDIPSKNCQYHVSRNFIFKSCAWHSENFKTFNKNLMVFSFLTDLKSMSYSKKRENHFE